MGLLPDVWSKDDGRMIMDEYMIRTFLLSFLFAVASIAVGVILVRLVVLLFYGWCKLIVDFKQKRFEKEEERKEDDG